MILKDLFGFKRFNGISSDFKDMTEHGQKKSADSQSLLKAYKQCLKFTAVCVAFLVLNLVLKKGLSGTVIFSAAAVFFLILTVIMAFKIKQQGDMPEIEEDPDFQDRRIKEMEEHYEKRKAARRRNMYADQEETEEIQTDKTDVNAYY